MTPDIIHHYFAYGSNMNPERVSRRQMRFESAAGGVLHNYSLRFNKRSVKYPGAASANVAHQPGSLTEGVVYRLSHPAQIEMMDPFEGYPVRYDRLALPIRTTGAVVHAWVYIANTEFITEGLSPARWYLEHLLAGEPFLSVDYVEQLRQTPCLPDSHVEPD